MRPEVFAGLIDGGWAGLDFADFRPGVTIHRLWRDPGSGAEWALLKYRAGASVPRHRHPGPETILVLEGAQNDEHGIYETGAMVCNAPGSVHSVRSEGGCVVLIHWALPVEILEEPRATT